MTRWLVAGLVIALVLVLLPDRDAPIEAGPEASCEEGALDWLLQGDACGGGEPFTVSLYYDGSWRTTDAYATPLLEAGVTSINVGAERTVVFRHLSGEAVVQEWTVTVGEQALVKVTFHATSGVDRITFESEEWSE